MHLALEPAVELGHRALEQAGLRPVVVAHDIWLAEGLQRALPRTALVCISRSDAIDHLRARGSEVFCLSEETGPEATAGMSSLELLRHPATAAFFRRLGATAVLCFKPSERIAGEVTRLGGKLLAASSSAARAYENKLAFVGAAERAGVPRPYWHARRLPADYRELESEYGARVVVQGARGNAGQRTRLVDGQAALDAVARREGEALVRVSEFIDGIPLTATGVAFSGTGAGLDPRRLTASVEPCRQVTGVPWLTPEPLGSCGNAWGDTDVAPAFAEVARCVRALGADLAANNYMGIFGVDFVLAQEGPIVIEVNPRMVASLSLATHLEVEARRAPLVLLHLLELLDARLDEVPYVEGPSVLGAASQLILHRLPGDGLRPPPGGVYRVDGGVQWLRPGAALNDLADDRELLLLTRAAGEPVTEGKEFARILSRSPMGENTAGVRALVDHTRGR